MGGPGRFEAKSLVGGTLGQFEVKSEIARGGMGVVYKGYQPSLDRWVAIKTLPMDLAGDRELVSRFQREAKAMAALQGSNNIVQVIDSGQDQGQYYMAMEYVEGPSVKDLLKSETIDSDKLFDVLTQTCDGLDYAHKKGLVHRDIKPANLLYEEKTGIVKIADFGIAHFSKKDEEMLTLTADNVGMGTMNYMSPEQKINAKSVDHKADIYALGVIVYEAFTGKLPLGKFKLPSEINPKLPRELDAIVQKCLEAEPKDRYGSCAELKAVLLQARAATKEKTLRRTMREAIDRTLTAISPNRTVGIAVLGCLFLLVAGVGLGGGGYWWFSHAKKKHRDELQREVAEAREKAQAALKNGAPVDAKIKDGETAEGLVNGASIDEQVVHLLAAREAYAQALSAASEWRQGSKKKLEESVAKAEKDAGDLPVADGFKDTATKALGDARKALDPLDGAACDAAIQKALAAIATARKIDDALGSLARKKDALPDDKKPAGDAALSKVTDARKSGDADAVQKALADAAAEIAKLGEKPVELPPDIKKPPVDNTGDMAAQTDAARLASDAAARVRDELASILEVARNLAPEAAKAEEGAASDALSGAAGAALPERAAAYDKAKKLFDAAIGAAFAQIRDAVSREEKKNAPAARVAPADWDAARRLEADVDTQPTRYDQMKTLVAAGLKFRKLAEAARAALDGVKAAALAARADAASRLGDKHPSLAAGDAALAKAADAASRNDASAALDAYGGATLAFDGAEMGMPVRATVDPINEHVTPLTKSPMTVIAPCPRGFVVGAESTLSLFEKGGKDPIARSDPLPERILAAASGEGDDVYVAYGIKGGRVARFLAANPLKQQAALPGDLGQPFDRSVFALAYHRPTHRLFAAMTNKVAVFSTVDGSTLPSITLSTQLHPPASMAVLADGTVALTGLVSDPTKAAAEWTFELRAFRLQGKDQWLPVGQPIANAPCAVTAFGDTLVGVTHEPEGKILAWKGGTALSDSPVEVALEPADKKTRFALSAFRIASRGRFLYMLDLPAADTVTPLFPLLARAKVYDLKEE
ncbi:MAG TPA: protein kinase [Planctomycetota bacterium]|nr:protein kinase [Planctomycetota bacterium]